MTLFCIKLATGILIHFGVARGILKTLGFLDNAFMKYRKIETDRKMKDKKINFKIIF